MKFTIERSSDNNEVEINIKCGQIIDEKLQKLIDQIRLYSFSDVPTNYIDEFKESMGVIYYINDKLVSNTTSIFILIASAIIFFFLSVLVLYKKKK